MIRVESLLKEEIARIIQKDFRSNLGLISITSIKVSKDLANATIFYSHLGSEAEKKKILRKIKKIHQLYQKRAWKKHSFKADPIINVSFRSIP